MGHWFWRGSLALVVVAVLVASCGRGAEDTTTTTEVIADETSSTTSTTLSAREGRNRGPGDTRPRRMREVTTTTEAEPSETTGTTTVAGSGVTTTVTDPGVTTTTSDSQPTTTTTLDPDTFTSSTTTTLGPSAGVGVGAPIGVIGCSNTHQAAEGYQSESSLDLLTQGGLGGGSINRWGNPNNSDYATYWGLFDSRRPVGGYTGVWINICLKAGQHDGTLSDAIKGWVQHTVEQAQARDPGVPIWISGLNFYTYVCEATGALGPVVAGAAADWAALELPGVSRGPDLGPLELIHTVQRDDCHLNQHGMDLIGGQLVEFFDGV